MKNNIAFKFIAILLCTLTLLGSLGSALGLYVMSEADLYHKTADQVREERIWDYGESLAWDAAVSYASQTLGGMPQGFVDNYLHFLQNTFVSGRYNYTILDGEGNPVHRYGDDLNSYTTYSFPISAKYYHLVSMETEQDIALREAQERAEQYGTSGATVQGIQIPREGLVPNYVSFLDQNGSMVMEIYDGGSSVVRILYNEDGFIEEHMDNIRVGELIYSYDGHLVFRSNFVYPNEELAERQIMEANFVTPDGVYFQLRDENAGVGRLYTENGMLYFTSLNPVASEQPQTETAPAVPQLTIDPTPGLVAINNNIPQEGISISQAAFYGPDGAVLYEHYDANGLGYLYYNQEGGLNFVLSTLHSFDKNYYLNALQNTVVAGVYFLDGDGNVVYQATGIDGVGDADASESRLAWKSRTTPVLTEPAPLDVPAEEAPMEESHEESEETSEEQAQESSESEEEAEESEEEPQDEENEETSGEASEDKSEEESEEKQEEETQAPEEDSRDAEEAEETEPATEPVAVEPTVSVVVETVPATEAAVVPVEETVPPTEPPLLINGKTLDEYQLETVSYYDSALEQNVHVTYVRVPAPGYTVELRLASDGLKYENLYTLLHYLREYRKILLPALGVCLLLFAITAVYLCTAAGRKPKCEEIRAGGLNRLPLDLYFALGFGIATFAGITGVKALDRLGWNLVFNAALALGTAFSVCLIVVAFCFAVAAQVKMPGGFWWRNSLCGQSLRIFIKFVLWLEYAMADKVFPFLGRLLKGCWKLAKAAVVEAYRVSELLITGVLRLLGRFLRWLWRVLHRFLSLLPITWQWMLAGCVILFLAVLTMNTSSVFVGMTGLVAIIAIILYGSHCFGVLGESTRKMSKGDLETKVDDKLLLGCFKDFAGDLNDLADVAVVAAQKQLKSERMKTELITNVSHDIKTPLTSIINYVDLLQKPHTEQEQEQYLEVLDRQSQRLKKLIDDLMDMSKASTGNMTVEITTVDAVESVNQALGEFGDKLNGARLTPVFRHTEDRVPMLADGKLVWRVLSNLLSNAVKYAMPGTRLYIDLMELEGKVVLSLKNISREALNVDAEELMERFVRGDDSRNTEGSGLGLNIAKSLMELQKGQLQLLVDGDLFKVTLIFPGA